MKDEIAADNDRHFYWTAGISKWTERLITKEDRLHVHKTLGITCLLSFLWRISQIDATNDMGFVSYPSFTIPTLTLHLALSLSSFEFKIPHQRIKEGSRIWPEYRWHSLIFASRSIVTMALYWYEQQYYLVNNNNHRGEPLYIVNVIIVLATMAAADIASASQNQYASNSIRQLDISRVTSYFFSVCQFYATAGVLFGVRRYTIQFLNVWVVQLNPFLMTLRRKNLISHNATVNIYGFMLVFGIFTVGSEYLHAGGISMLRTVAFVGNMAILWRMAPLSLLLPSSISRILQNKYLIWTVLGLWVHVYLRRIAYEPQISTLRHWIYTSSMMAVVINGIIKCRAVHYSHDHGTDSTRSTTTTTTTTKKQS